MGYEMREATCFSSLINREKRKHCNKNNARQKRKKTLKYRANAHSLVEHWNKQSNTFVTERNYFSVFIFYKNIMNSQDLQDLSLHKMVLQSYSS